MSACQQAPIVTLVQHMLAEGYFGGNRGLYTTAEVLLRRIYDEDPEVRLLARSLVFQYAHSRELDPLAPPPARDLPHH